jgi:transcriptional regulator with GAF, ATPase, and Fis domain/tetratricopeptide (TPR) repeat protein
VTTDPAAEVLTLALAASPAPLSIDTLVSWSVVRPSDLWAFLSAAQGRGELAQPEPGRFALASAARAETVVAAATAEAWGALLASPERIRWAMEAAREAAAARRVALANELWRGVLTGTAPERFPGGEAGFVGAVLEALRFNRAMYGMPTELYARALASAVALGDLAAQGVLHGTLAVAALRSGTVEEARAHLEAAREAARAVGGNVAAEIHVYLALGLAFQGRLRDAIDLFEELLGDVPLDVHVLGAQDSAFPATTLLVLSAAYCNAGEVPRALDLIHRLRRLGQELGNPALEREADLFAAIAHVTRGEYEPARPHAERAHAYYAGPNGDPLHVWLSGSILAAVRLRAGDGDAARALLDEALTARRAGQWVWIPAPAVLELFEQLEVDGISVEGLELGAELERILAGPSVFWRGVACRFRARRRARLPLPEGEPGAVRADLERAIALLRESGAAPELARALEDAEALARGGGRQGDAVRLAAELRETSTRAPLPLEMGAERRAPVAGILVELGRLGALSARREGTWGELAARLCRVLGAERCALFERGTPPPLLGGRGGNTAWRDAVQALLATRAPRAVEALRSPELPGDDAASLLVVPFAAEGRAGWACLENRHGRAAIGPGDGELLEVLSAQLGVLLGNLALWQELSLARERLEQENRYWRSTTPATAPGSRLVGDSEALRKVLDLVARVAPTTTGVLVTGETGVGKELVASEIHRQSPRRTGPFIAVHVASFSPGLVASGLFGHERGAFTGATEQAKGRFELADGGTLFLDEVGELSPEDQVRLLRVLQEGSFERVGGTRPLRSDFRLVAATNRDLQAEVRAGRFREDLYFRLAAFPLHVPPLRERREEIPTLALLFMERASRARGVRFEGIGEADMRRMVEYAWPGNVRELEHVIERAVVLSEPPRLRIPPLDAATRTTPLRAAGPAGPPDAPAPALVTLAEAQRRHIAAVLRHVGGRITGAGGAAEILGMKPSTLNFRIEKLGLKGELQRTRAVTER